MVLEPGSHHDFFWPKAYAKMDVYVLQRKLFPLPGISVHLHVGNTDQIFLNLSTEIVVRRRKSFILV